MILTIILAVIASTLRLATPLIFASLGGTFSERSGVVNIALEGMMLMGSFFAVLVTYIYGSSWLGVLGAVVAGVVTALLLAFMAIHLKANQVVVGTAINILAMSLTAYFLEMVWHRSGQTDSLPKELSLTSNPKIFAFLEKIPVLGDLFSRFTPFVYMAFFAVFLSYIIIFKTPFGLRIRAVGEHPRAADTLGISVYKIRYICVLISGGLAGLAGATLSLGTISLFREGMSVGKGFIALAAMIFGKWHPVGAMFACLFFGFTEAIQIQAQTIGIKVPPEFMQMLPYVATILALAGVVGKATAPASDGIPYEKGEK